MRPELRARLRACWLRYRHQGQMADVWQDFEDFVDWADDNGYCQEAKILRINKSKPASSMNCYLMLPGGPKGIPGGSEHIPCRGCTYEQYCPGYQDCGKYRAWLNASWELFREVARRKGWM